MTTEQSYYERAALWDQGRYATEEQLNRFAATAHLIPSAVTSVLDVGSGNGAFLNYLEQHAQVATMRGVERSHAAQEASVCRSPVDLGSIDALPYPDSSFDVVSALEVIEHLPEPIYEPSLAELARVARRYVLISVPYEERRHRVVCRVCGCRFHPSYHMRSFDKATLLGLVPNFAMVRLVTVDAADYVGGDLLRAAYRLISRGDDMPKGTVCPQCGFRMEGGNEHLLLTMRHSMRSSIRERLPRRQRSRWYVALYERTAADATS